jgi:uncharacterized membrane protein YjfL (UPF0719 family)
MNTLITTATPLVSAVVDGHQLVGALLYSLIGIGLFGLAFFIMVKVAPFSIRKEIEDDQNTALGIIIGSVIIGISLIIGAAVGG